MVQTMGKGKDKRMKLISSGEIRTRILKAIKGEEFCGGEKCLFYHECVADKRDTDCEEFITEMLDKGFRRSDETRRTKSRNESQMERQTI